MNKINLQFLLEEKENSRKRKKRANHFFVILV